MRSGLFLSLLAVAPALVSAAMFPKDTKVQMLDPKTFNKVMKEDRASVVAFVAPWCGHCKKMSPEYSKAAAALDPLMPLYAIDCDDHKEFCSLNDVKGFPTVKLYRRGSKLPGLEFTGGKRTANQIITWAAQNVQYLIKDFHTVPPLKEWIAEKTVTPRAVLLNKTAKVPLLWKILATTFRDRIAFGLTEDKNGRASAEMGLARLDAGKSKVLVYQAGSTEPVLFEGAPSFEGLKEFFGAALEGTLTPNVKVEEESAPAAEQVVLETPHSHDHDHAHAPTPEEPVATRAPGEL